MDLCDFYKVSHGTMKSVYNLLKESVDPRRYNPELVSCVVNRLLDLQVIHI